MFVIIWRYRADKAHWDVFTAAYGPDGEWAQLFRLSSGYVGTEMLVRTNEPGSFLVITRWQSEAAFLRFQESHRQQCEMLDRKYAALELDETFLGHYESGASALISG